MKIFLRFFIFISVVLTGCTYRPIFKPTPEPVETLFVGPLLIQCENPNWNNQCFQVKQTPEAQWSLYKGTIAGLMYEPGFTYQLEVQKDKSSSTETDVSEVRWVLYRLISKSKDGEATIQPYSILGVTWNLSQFGNPTALSDARGVPGPSLFFQTDGHISGSTGCNRFNATFTIDKDRIQFGTLAATKKMCPTGDPLLLEQEQSMLEILQQADHLVLEPDRLQILSSGNAKILIFKK